MAHFTAPEYGVTIFEAVDNCTGIFLPLEQDLDVQPWSLSFFLAYCCANP